MSQLVGEKWLVPPQLYFENFHPFYYTRLATFPKDLPHPGCRDTSLHYIQ